MSLASLVDRLSLETQCVVCRTRPRSSAYGTGTTCGLRCASILQNRERCVICDERPSFEDRLTCGLRCLTKLALEGGDPRACKYCLRRQKRLGSQFCSNSCESNALNACLFCRSRPRNGGYHLCGKACKKLATRQAPLLLEAPQSHTSFNLVEGHFKRSWIAKATHAHGPCPSVIKVYKIVENEQFLRPYDEYLKRVGNEVFRYHGTTSLCGLGIDGKVKLCNSSLCRLCNILRASFKTSFSAPGRAFGAAIYTSAASNKAYQYCDARNSRSGTKPALLVTKVALGRPLNVKRFEEVKGCPAGFDSVVYDRENGVLDETVVYRDDAIRPVFLITF